MATCLYRLDGTNVVRTANLLTSLDLNADGTCPPPPTAWTTNGTFQSAYSSSVGVSLSPTEYQQIMQAASGMPDPATGAVIWAAFFSLVLGCYLVAKPAGAILAFLRDS